MPSGSSRPYRYFNSRPSARGDAAGELLHIRTVFQFTPLREGRRRSGCWISRAKDFNSRPSARGDLFPNHQDCGASHFNSRPSARGDCFPHRLEVERIISIHAPPRGATGSPRLTFQRQNNFNSRPSARGDPLVIPRSVTMPISIHAPPRGATEKQGGLKASTTFQFTPLREGRPNIRNAWEYVPRIISIHAPPRGATNRAERRRAARDIFQFTPLREGRPFPSILHSDGRNISIHAPPRGATALATCLAGSGHISIHAPPRGATGL